MLNKSAFEVWAGRVVVAEGRRFQPELVQDFPDVPVLPETLLLMDLRVHDRIVDLRDLSQLVLGDLGATLQILRLAGREYGASEDRPHRIEECIADLGLQACLKAAASLTVIRDSRYGTILESWAHAREIAQYCRLLADENAGGVNPDEAYLTGLFHGLGELPALLGWQWSGRGKKDGAHVGLKLAEQWALPPCVREYFREMYIPGYGSQWSGLVQTAHLLARRSSIHCPLDEALTPQLHKGA